MAALTEDDPEHPGFRARNRTGHAVAAVDELSPGRRAAAAPGAPSRTIPRRPTPSHEADTDDEALRPKIRKVYRVSMYCSSLAGHIVKVMAKH